MNSCHTLGLKRQLALLSALVLLTLGGTSAGISRLRLLQPPPAFDLPRLSPEGGHLSLVGLRGKTTVLVFGELYHAYTLQALKELEILRAKLATGQHVEKDPWQVVLIVAQDATAEYLRREAQDQGVSVPLLHDHNRSVFGDYGVIVLPSIVVVGPEGNVRSSISGYPLAFSEMMTNALLFSEGKLSREQFEAAGLPQAEVDLDPNQVRAERLTSLARQLFRRGYQELALARFQEILKLAPTYESAQIGLAQCLIELRRLDQAETELRRILRGNEDDLAAHRAMAWIEFLRGGEELKRAHRRLDRILAQSPNDPEAQYLEGLVYEAEDKTAEALAYFKKAAEILLDAQP